MNDLKERLLVLSLKGWVPLERYSGGEFCFRKFGEPEELIYQSDQSDQMDFLGVYRLKWVRKELVNGIGLLNSRYNQTTWDQVNVDCISVFLELAEMGL